MSENLLSIENHDRNSAAMVYVYPVVSRRAGGVSVGINLNPNNACNWHCAYCQVPNLTRGSAPEIDLELLENELAAMLDDVVNGPFMARRVPEGCRRLCDVAISGNGEPTSCRQFDRIVEVIVSVMRRFPLDESVRLRLITNGSYMGKPHVRSALKRLSEFGGEVWIKVDSASEAGIARINGVSTTPEQLFRQVEAAANLCPTWLQTCMFTWDGAEPSGAEVAVYLRFVERLKSESVPVRGVLLYGLARPSLQPEAGHVGPVPEQWMRSFGDKIEQAGLPVRLSL